MSNKINLRTYMIDSPHLLVEKLVFSYEIALLISTLTNFI